MTVFKRRYLLAIIVSVTACAPKESGDTAGNSPPSGGNDVAVLALYTFYDQHLSDGGANVFQFIATSDKKYRIFVYGAADSALNVAPQSNFSIGCDTPGGALARGKKVCLTDFATPNMAYQFKITESTSLAQDYVIAVAEHNGERGEGSAAQPVELSLSTAHAGTIGGGTGAMGTSYFSFTTAAAGNYKIAISDDLPTLAAAQYLYRSPDFSSNVIATIPGEYALEASRTYYLLLQNSNASIWYHRYKLLVSLK